MKKIIIVVALISLFSGLTLAQSKYVNNEFSINALTSKEKVDWTPVMMSLPPSEGFSPNVSVQIQQYTNSLKEYSELSNKQFKQVNFKVIKNIVSKNSIVFEYSGIMQKRNLHWYAVAYKKGNSIYLVTATATQSQWQSKSKQLISCVNSFKLK
jgi:ABC-type antimicrobial peptide transport system permease subunit